MGKQDFLKEATAEAKAKGWSRKDHILISAQQARTCIFLFMLTTIILFCIIWFYGFNLAALLLAGLPIMSMVVFFQYAHKNWVIRNQKNISYGEFWNLPNSERMPKFSVK